MSYHTRTRPLVTTQLRRNVAGPSRTLSSQSSQRPLTPVLTAPKRPENPLHIYRKILRLAHRLAERWQDPYIFWTCKHISMRNLGRRERGGRIVKAPWAAISSSENSTRIAAQARAAFKRLKSTRNALIKAEQGGKKEMLNILQRTYAVQGILLHMGKKALCKSTHTRTGQVVSATNNTTTSPYYPTHPPSPILLAVLQSPTLLEVPLVQHDPIHRSLVAYYSPNRTSLPEDSGRLSVRKMHLAVEKRLEKLVPPLSFEVVRDLERRMSEITEEWLTERGASEKSTIDAITAAYHGPLHPSHQNYIRNQRRIYGILLSHLSSLITPDQIRTSWKLAISQDSQIKPSPTKLPPPPIFSQHWLKKPHLGIHLSTLWCSKLRLVTQSAARVYTSLNVQLIDNGHILPTHPVSVDQHVKGGSGFGKEIARELMWIYKSPLALVPNMDVAGGHSNVMPQSSRFVSKLEADLARDGGADVESPPRTRTRSRNRKGNHTHTQTQTHTQDHTDNVQS